MQERENGRWEMGPGRKGLRHSTTAGLARGSGLELARAGWLGWGWGWRGTDVELELDLELGQLTRQARGRLEAGFLSSAVRCVPSEYAANTGASVLSCLGSSPSRLPYHTEPARQDQHSAAVAAEAERAQDPRPEDQESRQRPSKTQRKPSSYSPRQHMDGEQLVSPTPCLTNSLLIGVHKGGSKRDGDQTPTRLSVCQSIL